MAAEMRFRNTFFNPASELDGIIYVSEFSKNLHESHNHRFAKVKNTVLYNFSKRVDSHESEDFFLYSGRLSSEKGCETMINAFRKNPKNVIQQIEEYIENNNFKLETLKTNLEKLNVSSSAELIYNNLRALIDGKNI